MRLQSAEALCGMNAVANACKALGLPDVSEAEVVRWVQKIRKVADPEVQGTTEEELLRAVMEGAPKKYRLHATQMWVHNEVLAKDAFRGLTSRRAFPVMAVDADAHWITGLATNGDVFLVADGAEVEITVGYSWAQLNARWAVAGDPPAYYALVLTRA
jgi:hypothetical protein